jgi:hypothetical protein
VDDSWQDHIRAVGRRSSSEEDELTTGMLRRCWPGGHADRSEPAALEWVRRWRPIRATAGLPACVCAAGRCAVCN